jgi:hypothetical protein
MRDSYYIAAPPATLQAAIAHIGRSSTITQALRRESRALERERWTLAERDLIRLAAISRRHHLAYRNDCCTVTERARKGRPRPAQ